MESRAAGILRGFCSHQLGKEEKNSLKTHPFMMLGTDIYPTPGIRCIEQHSDITSMNFLTVMEVK